MGIKISTLTQKQNSILLYVVILKTTWQQLEKLTTRISLARQCTDKNLRCDMYIKRTQCPPQRC